MDATPVTQSIAFLSKIEASAVQAQKIINTGNLDSLPKLYSEISITKTWINELSNIKEALDDLILAVAPTQTPEALEGNRNAQFNMDKIFAASAMLEQGIGFIRMIELIDNITHSSRKASRELKGLLEDLRQAV